MSLDIISAMESLGYCPNKGGMCYGIAVKAIDAVTQNDFKTFKARVELIHSYNDNQAFSKAVLNAEAKRKKIYDGIKNKESNYKDIYDRLKNRGFSHNDICNHIINDELNCNELLLCGMKAFFDEITIYFGNLPDEFIKDNKLTVEQSYKSINFFSNDENKLMTSSNAIVVVYDTNNFIEFLKAPSS